MKKPAALSIFFLFFCFRLFSQESKTADSLQAVFKKHAHDTTGVQTLIALAEEYYLQDPAKAESISWQANALSQELKYDDGMTASNGWLAFLFEQRGAIDSALVFYNRSIAIDLRNGKKKELGQLYNNVAAIYKNQGKIPEALALYEKAIALAYEAKSPKSLTAPLNNIGLIYQNQGQYGQALAYYERCLSIEDSLHNKDGIATSFYNIASVHKELGQYEEALDYVKKSLAAETELDDKYNIASSLNFIGTIYQAQGKLPEALNEFNKSLAIRKSISDREGQAYSLRNIGGIYEAMDSLQRAMDFYLESVSIFREQENNWGECSVLCRLGTLYFLQQNLPKATEAGTRSLQLAKLLGYPIDIRNAAELLQKIYRAENKWTDAIAMYDLFVQMKDSVQNDETQKAALKSKYKYEYEKKTNALKAEQEKRDTQNAEKIEREKLLRNFFIAGFILILLVALLLFNRYKIKQAANRELEEKNAVISAEKDRSEALLLNILPAEVAAELKENGSAKARNFENVTVMFTDFKDFTQISELLSPEELVREIDYCFSEFDRIISRYEIEKIKTVGDAYMCVSGLPAPFPDHAVRIVSAALDICAFMERYISEREAKGLRAFRVRIGVNTGPVVAGIVGIKKFAYDVWGDTVNLASRMESNGEAGKVNISSGTYALVKDHFNCEYRGKIEAKNKGMVEMYFAERK